MIYETSRFVIEIGALPLEVPIPAGASVQDQLPQYLVRNKDTGVIEFTNPALYFVRDWADQMTKAMIEQEAVKEEAPREGLKIVPFPEGGGSGRSH